MNEMNEIIHLLNRLAEFKAQITLINIEKQKLVDRVLTPEVKLALDEIDAEFEEPISNVQNDQREIEERIKTAVTEHGASVKGDNLQAVYSKPRTSWDTKKLDGFAAAHPEILQFKKVGNPSVSIRATK